MSSILLSQLLQKDYSLGDTECKPITSKINNSLQHCKAIIIEPKESLWHGAQASHRELWRTCSMQNAGKMAKGGTTWSSFWENGTNILLPAEYRTVFSGRTDASEERHDLTHTHAHTHTHTHTHTHSTTHSALTKWEERVLTTTNGDRPSQASSYIWLLCGSFMQRVCGEFIPSAHFLYVEVYSVWHKMHSISWRLISYWDAQL